LHMYAAHASLLQQEACELVAGGVGSHVVGGLGMGGMMAMS
jgi:hypothetical protein